MKYFSLIILIFYVVACSLIGERSQERDIQTNIIGKLNENAEKLSSCAKDHELFKSFNQERVRVVLFITLNEKGQIRKFKLDDKLYPDSFSNCVFNVVDLISFPKAQDEKLVEFEQPFIFSAK